MYIFTWKCTHGKRPYFFVNKMRIIISRRIEIQIISEYSNGTILRTKRWFHLKYGSDLESIIKWSRVWSFRNHAEFEKKFLCRIEQKFGIFNDLSTIIFQKHAFSIPCDFFMIFYATFVTIIHEENVQSSYILKWYRCSNT